MDLAVFMASDDSGPDVMCCKVQDACLSAYVNSGR